MEYNIDKMDLYELNQLKNILSELEEEYSSELTKYSIMNSDSTFRNMSDEERKMFNEKKFVSTLKQKVNSLIKEKIFTKIC